MPDWTPAERERIARAALAASDAFAELGAALAGDGVMAKVERDDMSQEERATMDALTAPRDCSDPPCGPHHDHYVEPGSERGNT